MNARIGLVAGSGQLPLIFARAMCRPDGPGLAAIVAHEGESDPALAHCADEILWVKLGQFSRILRYLQQRGARELILVGGIAKSRIWRARPDALALQMLLKLRGMDDDQLLRAVAGELEGRGFLLRSVTDYLPELLAPRGCLSRRQPTAAEWADIRHGWRAAKGLGALDIGQGVVVRRNMVVAAEAMEGTDAMLARAGGLIHGQGRGWAAEGEAVLVKVVKPMQDQRLDRPTIGPATLENMARAGIRVAAVEAGGTMILDPEATRRAADRLGLVLVGVGEEDVIGVGARGSE
ncbi:MAG: UDP-2,3-diacylglucosamine diphosphatase LpxI [Magnetococcales bacterium]|nr:UDP-2,3-diacylglucosamine diphosphatase LpxI [Magnetococcales bacterium]